MGGQFGEVSVVAAKQVQANQPGKLEHRANGGLRRAGLDAADGLLTDAGTLGEILEGPATLQACQADFASDDAEGSRDRRTLLDVRGRRTLGA